MSATQGLTALVLAGSRREGDPLAASAGVSHKALIPVAGQPMLERVVSALAAVPRIGRILIATGRDAADVALTTSFGHMNLVKFEVITEQVVET